MILEKSENLESEKFEEIKLDNLEDNQIQELSAVKNTLKDQFYKFINPFLGLLITLITTLFFGMSFVIVKWLENVDSFTISSFRFFVIFVLSIPSVVYNKMKHNTSCFPKGLRWALMGRSIMGCGNIVFHFYALKHMPLADTNLIAATSPIFTVIIARIFLKEKMYKLDLLNIAIVFVGIILIVKPPFIFGNYEVYDADSQLFLAIILLLVGAICQANVHVLLRFMKDVPFATILFHLGWLSSFIAGISSLFLGCNCLPQTLDEWIWMSLVGIFGFLAQLGLTLACKFDSATKIVLYRKAFDIMFSILFQITLFHVIPDGLKIGGAILITMAILSSGVKSIFDSNCK